jgi:ribosomal protein S18 acetylase RimI-like enzyme
MRGFIRVGCASCWLDAPPKDVGLDDYRIAYVRDVHVPTTVRGAGHGRALLRELTARADREGWTLMLESKAQGEGGLSTSQLVAWYLRHGFEVLDDEPSVLMARFPTERVNTNGSES